MSRLARLGRALRRRGPRILCALAVGLALLLIVWRLYRVFAGEPSDQLQARWHEGNVVVDRQGVPLRDLPSEAGLRGRSMPLDQLGDRLVVATIISEDRRFYDHTGVDTRAVARAIGQNARHVRIVSGASTITQQLVKLLDSEGQPARRTVAVKLREAARAQNLERVLTKQQILEAYLNRLNYGRGLVGPQAAAKGYFGVSPKNLSWAQAAFLAVIPRAPSYLDPYRRRDRVLLRQQALLDQLRDAEALSSAEHRRAKVELVQPRKLAHPFRAPHFVEALRAESRLSKGSLTRTSLDLKLQRDVEGLLRSQVRALRHRGARNAAVIVVDNINGEVLAYVGSSDFDDAGLSGQIDMVRALRQPGSTLKPFVYALAFGHGHTAAEMLADVPTEFGEPGGGYTPANFDGSFHGPVSAREALAGSLNVPAVRLAAQLPRGELLTTLRKVGLVSLDRDVDHYGLSLALGSGEVSLRQLATSYAVLARGGRGITLRYTLEPTPVVSEPDQVAPIIDPAIAASITESLADPLARVRGLGGRGPFDFGFPVAVKTGTSSGYRDAWCIGYTRSRTVAVWVGNADGSPLQELTGGRAAGPLFSEVMRRAMADVPRRRPLWDPHLLVPARICPLSGLPAGPACPESVVRHFTPTQYSVLRPRAHRHDESAADGATHCPVHHFAVASQATDDGGQVWQCDPNGRQRIVVLPAEYGEWLGRQGQGAPGRDPHGLPWLSQHAVVGCDADGSRVAQLRIEEPAAGSVLVLSRAQPSESQPVQFRASFSGNTTALGAEGVQFVLDGQVVAQASASSLRADVVIPRGDHTLRVRPVSPRAAVEVATSRFSVR